MKSKFLLLLSLILGNTVWSQLIITPGAQLFVAGNMQLTLNNSDLVNNGTFTAGNGTISFSGNASSFISGSQPVQFFEIEINKTNNSLLRLQRAIGVSDRVLFTSGLFNLNGFNTDLGTTGHLDGEQESTRFIGPNGGEVLFNVNLNSPTGSNPANLGVFITSGQNLGNVIIKRGHQSQATIPGTGSSIFRYYEIVPTNNTNLNATVGIRYFDSELNNLPENTLAFFKSDNNGTNWTALGFTSRDAVINFAEKAGNVSLSRFTLSTSNDSPLPIRFSLFNAKCEGNNVVITWKTAQEQNSSHFDIERSFNGASWTAIGNRPAAGNSSIERSYAFTDNSPGQKNYYRIAEYDLDGRVQYTSVLLSSCNVNDVLSVWPNPFHDNVSVNIATSNESQAIIKIFDSKGALVKMQKTTVLQGSNQVNISMSSLATGIYSVYAEWNNGQMKKAIQVLKQ